MLGRAVQAIPFILLPRRTLERRRHGELPWVVCSYHSREIYAALLKIGGSIVGSICVKKHGPDSLRSCGYPSLHGNLGACRLSTISPGWADRGKYCITCVGRVGGRIYQHANVLRDFLWRKVLFPSIPLKVMLPRVQFHTLSQFCTSGAGPGMNQSTSPISAASI